VTEYFSALGIKVYGFEEYGCFQPMHISVKNIVRYSRAIADIVKRERVDCIVGIMHTGSLHVSAARDIFRLKVYPIGTIEGNISAFFEKAGRKLTFIERLLLWYLLRRPSVIVVPSKGVKDDLEKNFGTDGRKIEVIYNAVEINHVRKLAEEKLDDGAAYRGKTIVTACRLNAQKDFSTLLRAFKEVRDKMEARLIIVGDGELRDEIIRNARDLGIENNVIITGFQKNPFPFFKRGDVFVLSSFFEGLPTVVVEALALGVPVVSSDCQSGPGEIIQNGVNGFLVPVQDYHGMADAIIRILTDEKIRNEFVLRGKQRAEFFNAQTMSEDFGKLISRFCR
jgi:glycosyltransferase involved in cell wall biosynthesis